MQLLLPIITVFFYGFTLLNYVELVSSFQTPHLLSTSKRFTLSHKIVEKNHKRNIICRNSLKKDEESSGVLALKTDEKKNKQLVPSDGVSLSLDNQEQKIFDDENEEKMPYGTNSILILCFFVAALSALDRVAMSVAILPLSSELHLTETLKGEISSAFSLGYGIAIIPIGLLVSTLSPTYMMACGLFLWSVGTLLTPYAASLIGASMNTAVSTGFSVITPLLVTRAIVGASESIVLPTTQKFLANWIPPAKRSLAIGFIYAGFQCGTIAAYLISPSVMENLGGWRELFYLYGTIGLLYLGPWLYFSKDSPSSMVNDAPLSSVMGDEDEECKLVNTGIDDDASLVIECETDEGKMSPSATLSSIQRQGRELLESAPWKDFAKSPAVIGITLAHAANNWGLYNNLAWTPTFYSEQYGLNVKESAFYSLVPSLAGIAGGLLAGTLADFIIEKIDGDDTTDLRKVFQGTALLGPAICLGFLSSHIPESSSTAQILLAGAVGFQAFNSAGYGPATQEKAGEKWTGLLYSVTSLPGVIFGTFGVYLTGQILDLTDKNWSVVFGLNACVDVVGALAFIALYNSKREFE